jgi:hypothetical protein
MALPDVIATLGNRARAGFPKPRKLLQLLAELGLPEAREEEVPNDGDRLW